MSDLPDYWSVALNYIKTVELIKLIERIKLIDEITKIGIIDKINPTATENVVIDRIAKSGTIDKINPTDIENVVINRIDQIKTIDKINPTATENVVIDRIEKITRIDKLNPTATENVKVDLIDKITEITKINPTATENVVIDRIDKLALIDEITKIAAIEKAYLEPQWAAKTGYDTVQGGCAVFASSGSLETVVEYVVPTGKTLMIYDWSGVIYTGDGQIYGDLYNWTDEVTMARSGGARGFSQSFFKPLLVTEGKTIRLRLRQDTGAAQTICGHFGGSLT